MFYCSKSLICIKGQGDVEPVPMYLSSASLVSDKQLCAYRFPFHLTGLILLLLFFFFYMFRILFICLFLAALGLHCFLPVVVSRGYSLIAVLGFLTAVASLAHRLQGMQVSMVEAHPWLQSTGSVVVGHRLSDSAACRILPDQGSNPCLLHWLSRSHQGRPRFDYFKAASGYHIFLLSFTGELI